MRKLVSTMERTTFTVHASEGWENSGLNVSANDLIFIQAEGNWTVSRNGWPTTDRQGYAGQINNSYAVNRDAPLGALLFRVRGSSNQTGYGLDKFGKGHADANGRLEFTINDNDRRNNDGQISLTIYVIRASALSELFKLLQAENESETK